MRTENTMLSNQSKYIGSRSYGYVITLLLFLLPLDAVALDVTQLEGPVLGGMLLAAVSFAILTFFKPKIGLFVMLIAMLVATDAGLGGEGGSSRRVSVRAEDLILILVSGGWLLRRAALRNLTVIHHVPINKAVLSMSLVIVAATLIGLFQNTVSLQNGFFFALKRIEFFWLFFMTLHIIESPKEVKLCIKLLLIATAGIAVVGVLQQALVPISEVGGGITMTAGAGRANTLGSFLLIMIGLSLGMFIYSSKQGVLWNFAIFAITMATLVFTKSRGAYVGCIPLLGVMMIITRSRRMISVLAVGLLIGILLASGRFAFSGPLATLLGGQTEDIAHQFKSIGDVFTKGVKADSSMNARVHAWRLAIRDMKRYPVLGKGVGSVRLGKLDNTYVREIAETGFIGFFCLIYLNIVILKSTFELFLMTDSDYVRGVTSGFIGGHIGMLVHGMAMSNFYTILNMEVFWFLAALVMLLYHQHTSGEVDYAYSGVPQYVQN